MFYLRRAQIFVELAGLEVGVFGVSASCSPTGISPVETTGTSTEVGGEGMGVESTIGVTDTGAGS